MSKRPPADDGPDAAEPGPAGPPGQRRPTATGVQIAVEAFGERLARIVVAWRLVVIAVSVLGAAAMAANVVGVDPSSDTRAFFGKDNPELLALQELEATYSRTESVLFIVNATDGDLFTAGHLTALAEMTEDAWQTPHVLRVDSIANFQTISSQGDDITVEPLFLPDEDLNEERLGQIRRKSLAEKELVPSLVSADGTVAGLSVSVITPEHDPEAVAEIAGFARDLSQRWQARWPTLMVRMTGGIMADTTFSEAGKRDERTLAPYMLLLLFGALAVGLRSLRATLVVMAVIVCTSLFGLGLAVAFGIPLNAATATSPVSIMVITVASAVHIILAWCQAGSGVSGREALIGSVRVNFAPVSATSITTVIGFLSLNFSDSPPLRDMGNIVAGGVFFSWVFCLTLLPALLSFVPVARPMMLGAARNMLERVSRVVIRRPLVLVALFAALLPVAWLGASRIVLDDNYIRYFDERFPFRGDTEFGERNLIGLNYLQFSLGSGAAGGIFEPEYLAAADRLATWLESRDRIIYVQSLTSIIKRLNQAVDGGDAESYRIADTRERNAQNLLLYELSLPVGQDLNNIIDIDRSRTKVTAFLRNASSRDIRTLAAAAEQWLVENEPEIAAKATGVSVAFAHVSERNIRSMISGTAFALVLVSAILLIAFQSLSMGAISLIPNLAPGFLAFGLWGYLVGNVNLAATVVSAMTFGIIVDDTIHLTMKYLRARRILGMTPEEAVRHMLVTVGFPVTLTTLAIAAGFAVIATSGFQLSQYLGALTVLTVGIALVADLFLYPAVLLSIERLRR